MQIERLFQIVYLLLGRKTITATELAKRFEVSTRTIYRDIDTLSAAGVPIYANRGKGGGIGLLENFVLNKSVLSEKEQHQILSALQSYTALNMAEEPQVVSKLSALFNKNAANWVEADFSDWSGQRDDLFPLLKDAILTHKSVRFDYYGRSNEHTRRHVLPLQLWFKHKSWYLKGFCLEKQAYRLFKLSRLKQLQVQNPLRDDFVLPPAPTWQVGGNMDQQLTFTLKIDASQAYRIYDEYDAEAIETQPDGSFLVTVTYPHDPWVLQFILSYGPYAEVMAPDTLKREIAELLKQALARYVE